MDGGVSDGFGNWHVGAVVVVVVDVVGAASLDMGLMECFVIVVIDGMKWEKGEW